MTAIVMTLAGCVVLVLFWPSPKCPRCGSRKTERFPARDDTFLYYCEECNTFFDILHNHKP